MAHIKQRLFVINLLVMASVVLTIAGGNFWVDPFNVRGADANGLEKQQVAYFHDRCLWKLAQFANDPQPRILLGDSRMGNLGQGLLEETGGGEYYNFAFGGGTLKEMISTFDWVTRRPEQAEAIAEDETPPPPRAELKTVIFGLNMVHLNARIQADRMGPAEEIYESRFRYVMSPVVTTSSLGVLNLNYLGGKAGNENPPLKGDQWWNHQIEVTGRNHFRDLTYYEEGIAELREIAAYCQEHDIALAAIIFPEHADYLARIDDFEQQETYARFRRDVAEIFPHVYDFSGLEASDNAENFRDPLHFSSDYARQWLPQVFEELP